MHVSLHTHTCVYIYIIVIIIVIIVVVIFVIIIIITLSVLLLLFLSLFIIVFHMWLHNVTYASGICWLMMLMSLDLSTAHEPLLEDFGPVRDT